MCRNIKTLYNFEPHASNAEIEAASLQFVRKITGFNKPSQANEAAFDKAVEDIAHIAHHLFHDLVTTAEPYNREEVAAKAHTRAIKRFSTPT
jgi:hypothetical protein